MKNAQLSSNEHIMQHNVRSMEKKSFFNPLNNLFIYFLLNNLFSFLITADAAGTHPAMRRDNSKGFVCQFNCNLNFF